MLRRSQGDRYVERQRTLGEEMDAWLARKRSMVELRPATIRFYEQSARVWQKLADVPVSSLRRAQVEDFVAARADKRRRAAKNELELLKRVLRDARARGQRVDEAVLAIPHVQHASREGWALTVEQLYELSSWTPDHSKRLVLLAGMVGQRQRVWFEMTDDLLDLRGGTLAIPGQLSKNKRPHRLYLNNVRADAVPGAVTHPGSRHGARVPDPHRQAVDGERVSSARVGEGDHGGGKGRESA